ncbi:MAG: dodecin domain-containing protein [Firmicutes bacterium]|jgi:flavin-binding protein dodecin|nr:dodecin domain-containing protein [Bacillota bacterium]
MSVIKVIELVGQSDTSWEDAVRQAIKAAAKTVRHIRGVEVLNFTAQTDENGNISSYRANVHLAFEVER